MSLKSVAEKLLIKPGTTVWMSDSEHLGLIEPLPSDARVVDRLEEATTALVFVDDADSLHAHVAKHADRLVEPETLWVAYPKAGRTDINRDTVWPVLAERALRPIAQVSLGEIWSAIRFRPLKPGEEQFKGGGS
jgi:hypothetical protein